MIEDGVMVEFHYLFYQKLELCDDGATTPFSCSLSFGLPQGDFHWDHIRYPILSISSLL